MLSGHLSTMPLQDILQWVDASGVSGMLTVVRPVGETQLMLSKRRLVRISTPPTGSVSLRQLSSSLEMLPDRVRAEEQVIDLFLNSSGEFHFHLVRGDAPFTGTDVDLSLTWLVFEGLRVLDEWREIDRIYPRSQDTLRLTDKAPALGTAPAGLGILDAAQLGMSLGAAWVALGLSRPSLLRHAASLERAGLIEISGDGDPEGDPVGSTLKKIRILLEEEQFDEAALVLDSLLEADRSDDMLRRLKDDVEQRHIAALYRKLPVDRVAQATDKPRDRLPSTDRCVLELLTEARSVGRLVSDSPLKELPTLRALGSLIQRGFAR